MKFLVGYAGGAKEVSVAALSKVALNGDLEMMTFLIKYGVDARGNNY